MRGILTRILSELDSLLTCYFLLTVSGCGFRETFTRNVYHVNLNKIARSFALSKKKKKNTCSIKNNYFSPRSSMYPRDWHYPFEVSLKK